MPALRGSIDSPRPTGYEFRPIQRNPLTLGVGHLMRRQWLIVMVLGLAGCTGFDEFYLHDAFEYEAASETACGCAGGPRIAPSPMYAPRVVQNTSGSAPLPQSREPELLR
jgi:hypothetical protein